MKPRMGVGAKRLEEKGIQRSVQFFARLTTAFRRATMRVLLLYCPR